MAFLLGCEKASLDYPTKPVLAEVSLGVDAGDRIGIVGRNGEGKSTLLRVLAGAEEPDSGRVLRSGSPRVGLLGQRDSLDAAATVREAVVGDAPEYLWAGDERTRDIIAGLLDGISWEAAIGSLSGGQRRRVDLARLLAGDWDVLMLDEPTNHLDVRAITWLARHLRQRWKPGEGALLVVTHDRWFLDEVCTHMWEVNAQKVQPFEGGFSAYVMQRVERDRLAALAEQKRQNALRRELAWLSRGARARATKPKFHVAAARALIADVPELRDSLELKRMAMARLGKQVVDLEGVSVSFDDHEVLRGIDWMIGPGDRVGIVGGNGAGKTTLLRVIQGLQPPSSGRVKIGQTVRFAVLSQHLDNLADLADDRVREVVGRYSRRVMLDGKEMTPAQLLERLEFSPADLNEPVGSLSGGQRRRLALMLILLDEPNVLILDEPGNDLDTDMLAALEDLLDGWPGTLVLVTHDRSLMERVTDDQFALIDGHLRHLPRGIDEYLELTDGAGGTPGALGGTPKPHARPSEERTGAPARSGGELREMRKAVASLERKATTAQGRVEAKRAEMAAADPADYEALGRLQAELDELRGRQEELETEWLEAAEALADAESPS